ncbi:aminopeptidase N [Methylomagnum ishizawai]|uniref:Aminopeptidase N n=1 Tax=Methylomagnum ishizawai TaxID=1760988 RepID=A0A1Y6CYK9_9GAMM|nr:aminopeptidase N [Methylomagnum ishizawai]SMF95386.1 aminopeptidase N [Methylomagnum ishizawai]
MREPTPRAIHLKDYTPPEYLVDTVDLFFELDEENTRVTAKLRVRRNPDAGGGGGELELCGEDLILETLKLNGRPWAASRYRLTPEALFLSGVPDRAFDLEIVTRLNPKANTALEGLYLSNGMFCTQCEAQGFRKITYFPDRPDVMAVYTTTLVADRDRYPVLLSNGNPIAQGELKNGRHWVKWEDPFKKPCYLFALVAGRLACLEEDYRTASGRGVKLQIFAEPHDLDKCGHAMQSLRNAMRWDEETYGREYDLDLYMIVAVNHFNMGAMENKGLNIFNTKYVLARPDTATDTDYEHIEGVIGHEYFHNWTGNRITCRDWFQLSLKEGLTVFRDQEFSASRTSRPVKRIDSVNMLRTRQFAEDSGPLAHPVRPESYIEINNFYTMTVYEKGAEVVRMLHTLLGADGFRRGSDLYFQRHDGQAVTCDDFVKCMEDANGVDLAQFRRWYSQAGTPELHLHAVYDAASRSLALTVRQNCPPTPGQPVKQPFHIPLAVGLLGPDGRELPLRLEGEAAPHPETTRVLHVQAQEQRFRFVDLPAKPVVSALRGFSAPVKLHVERSPQELAFLCAHDPDFFNRWDAGQELAARALLRLVPRWAVGETSKPLEPLLLEVFRALVAGEWEDRSYQALLLTLPSEEYVGAAMKAIEPEAVHAARQWVKRELAVHLEADFLRLYQACHEDRRDRFDAATMGRRRLKNTCLAYLGELETRASQRLAVRQFRESHTMTDRIAALSVIVNSHNPEREVCLDEFYQQWKDESLVVGKWFSIQATCHLPGTLARVRALIAHPAFDFKMPNHVRSLIGAFSQSNPVNFHAKDGAGYAFLADHVIELNTINPQIAARLLTALTPWRRYDDERQRLMCLQLQRVAGTSNISKDVYEVAMKSLS